MSSTNASCQPTDPLLVTLKTRLPGITDDLLNLEIFNTVNEFCRSTNAWKFEQGVSLQRDQMRYDIFPPVGSTLIRVMEASHHGLPMSPIQAGAAAQSQRGRMTPDALAGDGDPTFFADELQPEAQTGTPFHYAVYFPQYVTIDVMPDLEAVKYPVILIMSLSLEHGCVQCDCGDWALPDWMWETFFEDFLDGVLGRCFSMPAKPWGNPTMASYHGKRFRAHMAFRRQEARRGFVNDVAAWRFPVGGFILR